MSFGPGTPLQHARGLFKVLACVALSALAQEGVACGSAAAQSVLESPQVARKFSQAMRFCDEGRAPQAVDSPASKGAAPLNARFHAQQLSLYDAPPVGYVAAPAATPGLATPEVSTRPLKGPGRDAASRALALVPEINRVAAAYAIDPLLLHAIAHVESRHNPDAVSRAGALGLMQVMPATARRFGVTEPHTELRNPTISLEVSSAYLKTLQRRFNNNLTLVIAAYNAGEGAVEKYGRKVPPYKETQGYVRDVMAHYLLLVGARNTRSPAAL